MKNLETISLLRLFLHSYSRSTGILVYGTVDYRYSKQYSQLIYSFFFSAIDENYIIIHISDLFVEQKQSINNQNKFNKKTSTMNFLKNNYFPISASV